MPSALDSTHTVVVKSENRGLRVVIGLLAVILLTKWCLTGSLLFAFESIMPPEDGSERELRSVTGALLPIAIDILWFIGSVIIFAATNLWAVLWDVTSGIFETFRHYSARRAAVDAAKKAATEAGSDAAETNAGAIASTAALEAAGTQAKASQPRRVVDIDKLAEAVIDHDRRLGSLELRIESMQGTLSDVDSEVLTVRARVETLETALAESTKATASRPTRSSSRRKTSGKAD